MKDLSELKTTVHDYAVENFKSGFNCAESVYEALMRCGAFQAPEGSLAMCVGFGGGIGLSGNTCGALVAAVMANGAVFGRKNPRAGDKSGRGGELAAKYYRRYNRMVHDFRLGNNGVSCAEICAPFDDWHGRDRRIHCLKLIAATAVMALEYLNLSQDEAFRLPYEENLDWIPAESK